MDTSPVPLGASDQVALAAYGIALCVALLISWLWRQDYSDVPIADLTSPLPYKLWLVQGERPAPDFPLVWYETDPRKYGLPDLRLVTDEEYEAMADRVKVFKWAGDAVDFMYACGLDGSGVAGFRLVNGRYQLDKAVTFEVLDTHW